MEELWNRCDEEAKQTGKDTLELFVAHGGKDLMIKGVRDTEPPFRPPEKIFCLSDKRDLLLRELWDRCVEEAKQTGANPGDLFVAYGGKELMRESLEKAKNLPRSTVIGRLNLNVKIVQQTLAQHPDYNA